MSGRIAIGNLDLHDPHNAVAVGPFLSDLGKNLIQAFGWGLDVLQPNLTSHVNGVLATIGQDDKVRWSPVVMGAESNDVDFGHGGREHSEKTREGQEGAKAVLIGGSNPRRSIDLAMVNVGIV